MFQTLVSCYLWDLVDEGIEEVLDRLQGEAGATGVGVGVCCPRTAVLRPHRGPLSQADASRLATGLSQPLVVVPGRGAAPRATS